MLESEDNREKRMTCTMNLLVCSPLFQLILLLSILGYFYFLGYFHVFGYFHVLGYFSVFWHFSILSHSDFMPC